MLFQRPKLKHSMDFYFLLKLSTYIKNICWVSADDYDERTLKKNIDSSLKTS